MAPLSLLEEATSAAVELGLATHLDGARLWNASAAAGVSGPAGGSPRRALAGTRRERIKTGCSPAALDQTLSS